ncbi:hypothetical protein J6590_027326 [Homalodisca vitripennis]|nr:hypothetical protein J6590_027326 [Homalodisca vitripennis]
MRSRPIEIPRVIQQCYTTGKFQTDKSKRSVEWSWDRSGAQSSEERVTATALRKATVSRPRTAHAQRKGISARSVSVLLSLGGFPHP